MAKLTDQIERAGDENGVFERGFGKGVFEGALGIGDHGKMHGVMACDFRELRGGNGSGGAGRGEDEAGDFVDGFSTEGGVDQKDFAAGEILLEEIGEFAGGTGIVRAIEINIGRGLQFFETAGPDGVGNALSDGGIGDFEATGLEKTSGGDGAEGVLQLETTGQAGGNFEGFAGVCFDDTGAGETIWQGFSIDAKDLSRFDNRAGEFLGASEDYFASFRALLGQDEWDSGLQDPRFFRSDFVQGVAEKVFVVEIDAGNDGDNRRKNVGGVETATEADFEDAECYALAGERFEGHGGDAFEISGMSTKFACGEEFFNQDLDASESIGESGVADFFAIEANAFVD